MKGQRSAPAGRRPDEPPRTPVLNLHTPPSINTHVDVLFRVAVVAEQFEDQSPTWKQCVFVPSPLSSVPFHTHTHTLHVAPWCDPRSSWRFSQRVMMFVPSKSEQLLRDLAPHPALSRSGTQWLLSYSLIPLWFILVLFAFPECNSICFTVLRSLPSPVLCQYNITHPSTRHNAAFCLRVCVCVLIGQIAMPYFFF